jgi:hypothetical protein
VAGGGTVDSGYRLVRDDVHLILGVAVCAAEAGVRTQPAVVVVGVDVIEPHLSAVGDACKAAIAMAAQAVLGIGGANGTDDEKYREHGRPDRPHNVRGEACDVRREL